MSKHEIKTEGLAVAAGSLQRVMDKALDGTLEGAIALGAAIAGCGVIKAYAEDRARRADDADHMTDRLHKAA